MLAMAPSHPLAVQEAPFASIVVCIVLIFTCKEEHRRGNTYLHVHMSAPPIQSLNAPYAKPPCLQVHIPLRQAQPLHPSVIFGTFKFPAHTQVNRKPNVSAEHSRKRRRDDEGIEQASS